MKTSHLTIGLALALASSAQAAETGFKDPLDVPALTVATDRDIMLTGVGTAGSRIVAVGPRGVILYEDLNAGGAAAPEPSQARVPVGSDLTSLFLVGDKTGYAVGHDGVVLATSDGGATWEKRLDGRDVPKIVGDYYNAHPPADAAIQKQVARIKEDGADLHFLDAWFSDETHGFVIGAFNLILATEDGGKTWTPWLDRTDNAGGFHLQAIRPVGSDVFMVGEQGLIRRLDKANSRFVTLPSPYKGTLFGVTGKTGAVVVYGLRGHAFISSDTGATWTESKTGITETLTGGAATKDGRILLASMAGTLLVSTDSGASFTPASGGRRSPIFALGLAGERLALAGNLGLKLEPLP